jgi:DNA-binding response OmpR family regulator
LSEFRIFVVDDEEMMTDLMDAILAPHYPIEVFHSAEDCLEAIESRARANRPWLVVLDVGLPGVSGYECCRLIRAMDADIRVLFVSGHDTPGARVEARDAGGDDFMVKPFDTAELLCRIRALAPVC